jgi:hypothetical protein
MLKGTNLACHRRVFEMPVAEAVWLIRRSETVRSEVGRCPLFELVTVTLGYQLHTDTYSRMNFQTTSQSSVWKASPALYLLCVRNISLQVHCSVRTQENGFVTHEDSTGWRYMYAVCYIYYHNNTVLPAY